MDSGSISSWLDFFQRESWLVQVFIVLLATAVCDVIQKRVIDRIQTRFEATNSLWGGAFTLAIRAPLRVMIWLVGSTVAISAAQWDQVATSFTSVDSLRDVGVIIVITWFLVRFIGRIEELYVEQCRTLGTEMDPTTADAIAKLVRVSVIIVSTLVVLQTLGYSISGVLAFGGVGGIAVGFAAKDLLANFFGGLMVYLDRPFSVGDWVRSPDREIEGTVEKIGWRLTVIRTFDKRPLYIPNSLFTQIVVENPSRMTNRRIYETIGLRYGDAEHMLDVVEAVKTMLRAHPDIDGTQTMIVNFNEMAPSSIDFFVYTFTKTTDWERYHEVKQDVMLKIMQIIESQGAECAFPTSTIFVSNAESR